MRTWLLRPLICLLPAPGLEMWFEGALTMDRDGSGTISEDCIEPVTGTYLEGCTLRKGELPFCPARRGACSPGQHSQALQS